jgi:hypothetical protein
MANGLDMAAMVGAITDAVEDAPGTLDETRERLIFAARDAVPNVEIVSMTVRCSKSGRLSTAAMTDPLALEIDRLQYELQEGPCYEAVTRADLVVTDDLPREERWPALVAKTADSGIRSQAGVRVSESAEICALNLYSTKDHAFSSNLEEMRIVSRVAGLVLDHARESMSLRRAIETRTVIGQAIGILMERFGLDEADGFAYLTRISQSENVKLRDVARRFVGEVSRPSSEPRPR